MEKKSSSLSIFIKMLNKKWTGGGGGGLSWRLNLKNSAGLRWKRRLNLHIWFVDVFLFKIVSVIEGVVLVSGLCFFFLCCGCHF